MLNAKTKKEQTWSYVIQEAELYGEIYLQDVY